ncbi:MAG: hypothetical protein JL50_03015 [Peptococcaceae bacterium BICA1-7]|nr:MAG: hypothetical protein JL50_03015 [Peptococcaceae bacterium BICA1-7]HBV97765.1 hypothetical protein [Desulfotomaculum sp.]
MRKKNTAKTYDIAKAAAAEALKEFKDEERQQIRRTRYHNTELLLKKYLSLLDHYENAKDKVSDIISVEDLEELDVDDVIIKAIKRSRVRTLIMITQIDTCLNILRLKQASKGQPEKYEVIYCLYLDRARRDIAWGELIEAVAHELNCSTDSVRRWKNEMVRELSILLFGVDGLRLDI